MLIVKLCFLQTHFVSSHFQKNIYHYYIYYFKTCYLLYNFLVHPLRFQIMNYFSLLLKIKGPYMKNKMYFVIL